MILNFNTIKDFIFTDTNHLVIFSLFLALVLFIFLLSLLFSLKIKSLQNLIYSQSSQKKEIHNKAVHLSRIVKIKEVEENKLKKEVSLLSSLQDSYNNQLIEIQSLEKSIKSLSYDLSIQKNKSDTYFNLNLEKDKEIRLLKKRNEDLIDIQKKNKY